jgi:hypothetical protein
MKQPFLSPVRIIHLPRERDRVSPNEVHCNNDFQGIPESLRTGRQSDGSGSRDHFEAAAMPPLRLNREKPV